MIQHLLTEPSIVSRELQYSVPDKSQQDKSSLWWYISVAAGSFPSHSKHAEQLGAVPPFPDEHPPQALPELVTVLEQTASRTLSCLNRAEHIWDKTRQYRW